MASMSSSTEVLEICISPRESPPATCNSPAHLSSSPTNKRKTGAFDPPSSNQILRCNAPSHEPQEVHRYGGRKSWTEFLQNFGIENYRICVGLCSQALLWRAFAESPSLEFWGNIGDQIHLGMWCLGLLTLVTVSIAYALKCVFCVDVVKKEYNDRVGVNYFFAPWISSMLLMLGIPPLIKGSRGRMVDPIGLWCVFMAPVIGLEVKIYGQWFFGGGRLLSRVANPSTHLSIVGNFVGAMVAAPLGWKEAACFLFAIGAVHHIVLFVTLYQRLPSNLALPEDLHPVFFLFLAVPSTASLAWEAISGTFGLGSRMPYFLALFLFATMAVRPNFFSRCRFSVVWWAYAFPVTAVATASVKYADDVRSPIVKVVAFIFSFISTATVALLVISTVIHTLFFTPRQCTTTPAEVSPPSKRRKFFK